jgi:hypothetical protein
MIETAGGDVDLVWPTFGLVSERRAASVAESAECARLCLVSMRSASFEFEVGTLYDDPGHRLRARRPPAIFTMTIRADARLTFYLESNFAAVTSASYHTIISYPKATEDWASTVAGIANTSNENKMSRRERERMGLHDKGTRSLEN